MRVKAYPGLDALPESYIEIFQTGAQSSFFLSQDWFRAFIEHVVKGTRQPRIYGVESENDVPLAALPLVQTARWKGAFSPASFESLTNYYTCYFAPVMRNDKATGEVLHALAAGLWRDRDLWDIVKLQPIPVDSPIYETLVASFRDVGMVVQTYYCFGNWYLDVGGRSYQEYLESLSSVLRKNVPYNLRRLEKTGRAKIMILAGPEGLETALDDYERIYKSSWKVPEPYPQFIREVARIAARNGWLRLGLIYIDSEPAAVQIWLVHENRASIYKIAYDERFAKFSVGTVLTAKLMEQAIDVDNVTVVDYGSGDDDYKKNWMSHRREFWGILAFNPRSLHGLMQIARHFGGRFGKKAFHRMVRGKKDSLKSGKRDLPPPL